MGHPLDANGHKKILKGGRAFLNTSHMTTIGAPTEGKHKGKPHELTVKPMCGGPSKPCCITHGEVFDNAKALAAHVGDKRDHVTAHYCTEECIEERGVDAFGNPQIVTGVHGLESDREIEL